MNSFKEFDIKPVKSFSGPSIEIMQLVNQEIIVNDFRIEESKYPKKDRTKCLYLQITFEGKMRVVFSGSGYLMEMIKRVPEDRFPFSTVIKRENKHFEFT